MLHVIPMETAYKQDGRNAEMGIDTQGHWEDGLRDPSIMLWRRLLELEGT